MERPPSRASQDSVGGRVIGASTGSRPYSAQRLASPMKPPGTALRTARPGTGVQGWSSPSPFVPQVADLPDLPKILRHLCKRDFLAQVADRPITQQGMAGPKTASGSGRQVADKTFYLAQLRQKRSELIEVTSQLQVCVGTHFAALQEHGSSSPA